MVNKISILFAAVLIIAFVAAFSAPIVSYLQSRLTEPFCDSISNWREEMCFERLAIQEKDTRYCQHVGDSISMDTCISNVNASRP